MSEITPQPSKFLVENHAELKRELAELKQTNERLRNEISQLKKNQREAQIVNDLEKAFYVCGGKTGKDDDGYSYFDLIRDRAMKFVQVDDKGKVTFVDPSDNLPLRKNGRSFTAEDLMERLKGSATGVLFDSGSATIDPRSLGTDATREQLRQIKDPAARLARARELEDV